MSANPVSLPYDWDLSINDEGHRTYQTKWKVETTSRGDGPGIALAAPGLPFPGSSLAIGNCIDPWAFYSGNGSARLIDRDKTARYWDVTIPFSTRPIKRCCQNSIQHPLLEPHKVSGGFTRYTKKVVIDADGDAIETSAGQPYTNVDRDFNRPTVAIEMNCSWVDLAFLGGYVDAINDDVWWGQAAHTIKCTEFSWEEVLYGTCHFYFKTKFGFELNLTEDHDGSVIGWDVEFADYGSLMLDDDGNQVAFTDVRDNAIHEGYLDGNGQPLTPGDPYEYNTFQIYPEKDFSVVGWPSVLFH